MIHSLDMERIKTNLAMNKSITNVAETLFISRPEFLGSSYFKNISNMHDTYHQTCTLFLLFVIWHCFSKDFSVFKSRNQLYLRIRALFQGFNTDRLWVETSYIYLTITTLFTLKKGSIIFCVCVLPRQKYWP